MQQKFVYYVFIVYICRVIERILRLTVSYGEGLKIKFNNLKIEEMKAFGKSYYGYKSYKKYLMESGKDCPNANHS